MEGRLLWARELVKGTISLGRGREENNIEEKEQRVKERWKGGSWRRRLELLSKSHQGQSPLERSVDTGH